jgi:hypothetical protein
MPEFGAAPRQAGDEGGRLFEEEAAKFLTWLMEAETESSEEE